MGMLKDLQELSHRILSAGLSRRHSVGRVPRTPPYRPPTTLIDRGSIAPEAEILCSSGLCLWAGWKSSRLRVEDVEIYPPRGRDTLLCDDFG